MHFRFCARERAITVTSLLDCDALQRLFTAYAEDRFQVPTRYAGKWAVSRKSLSHFCNIGNIGLIAQLVGRMRKSAGRSLAAFRLCASQLGRNEHFPHCLRSASVPAVTWRWRSLASASRAIACGPVLTKLSRSPVPEIEGPVGVKVKEGRRPVTVGGRRNATRYPFRYAK